ncbi:MAG: porin [Beijerinckiaceae bacterium]|nr:porin [Beijerinckiaceae bacterium]
MKLVKSLLLGSAAGLVAVAGASAADLGVKKPTAVEYVKTCPTYGAGFFVVPGTTSCLKIVGRVRADYIFNNDLTRAADKNTFRARGYFGYDHRTATEYGLLRTYVRGFIGRDNNAAYAPVLEYAFIQFGGLTAGRVTPVWEHGWAWSFIGGGAVGTFSDISYVNSIGYTASFGGGFSATIALDSAAERRTSITGGAYAGQAMPDVVGKLAYDASWGSAYVAGAVHQIRTSTFVGGVYPGTKYGWAISGGVKFNLPMLTKGSNLWLNAAYADGASSYTGWGGGTVGQFAIVTSDARIIGTSLRTTRTWTIGGGAQVYFTPTIWGGVIAGYGQHDASGAANTIRAWDVTGTVGWTPVAGFLIGGEVTYRNVSASAGVIPAGTNRDNFQGRIRFQRDF